MSLKSEVESSKQQAASARCCHVNAPELAAPLARYSSEREAIEPSARITAGRVASATVAALVGEAGLKFSEAADICCAVEGVLRRRLIEHYQAQESAGRLTEAGRIAAGAEARPTGNGGTESAAPQLVADGGTEPAATQTEREAG
jgi:hypothetical protein